MLLPRVALFIVALPLWGLITCFRYVKSQKSCKKFFSKRELLGSVLCLYLLCVVALTIFPLNINLTHPGKFKPMINVIPVVNTLRDMGVVGNLTMKGYMLRFWIKNIVGNLILLMPLGVIAPLLWKKLRNVRSILVLCFCTTLTIECSQYISSFLGNMRSFDVDDLILNTLGGVIGYFIIKSLNYGLNKGKSITCKTL